MKFFVTAAFALLSATTFAQSYMVLQNGVTLTLDKNGIVFDLGQFVNTAKITLAGGQYLIEDKELRTVDAQGLFYKKDFKVDAAKVKGKGLNYLILKKDGLMTLDDKGFFYDYSTDKTISDKAVSFGGNFFTVMSDPKKKLVDLYVVNSKGNYLKATVPGLNPADIKVFGGKYFVTTKGVLSTVSKDGFVFSKSGMDVGTLKKMGGNYFINDKGIIYTVSEEGYLLLPSLPLNFSTAKISKFGSQYMMTQDGTLFVVDGQGNVIERKVPEHDLRNAKHLSI